MHFYVAGPSGPVWLPTGRGARFRPPCRYRLVRDPNGQATSPPQCRVVFRPVRDPMARLRNVMAMLGVVFERHGGCSEDEWDHPAPSRPRPPISARSMQHRHVGGTWNSPNVVRSRLMTPSPRRSHFLYDASAERAGERPRVLGCTLVARYTPGDNAEVLRRLRLTKTDRYGAEPT